VILFLCVCVCVCVCARVCVYVGKRERQSEDERRIPTPLLEDSIFKIRSRINVNIDPCFSWRQVDGSQKCHFCFLSRPDGCIPI